MLEMELEGGTDNGKPTPFLTASTAQNGVPEEQDGGVKPSEEKGPEDDPDERSVFVKNVDFSADDQQLQEHFKECGEIVRVTIRKNPHTN